MKTKQLIVCLSCLGYVTMLSGQNPPRCGDTVSSGTVNLRADLACPGDGLIVAGSGVTINLNGYRIIGQGAGAGIRWTGGGRGLVVNGPGRIQGFATGVDFSAVSDGIVQKVTFANNAVGVYLHSSQTDRHLIRDNTIIGGNLGIHASFNVRDVKLKKNAISGQTDRGIFLEVADGVVTQNVVRNAGTGIETVTLYGAKWKTKITLNRVEANRGDGMVFRAEDFSQIEVEGNQAIGNQGHGFTISLRLLLETIGRFEDNRAVGNRGYGLAVRAPYFPTNRLLWRILENEATGNGLADVFSDAGGQVCYSYNTFGVTIPTTLANNCQ